MRSLFLVFLTFLALCLVGCGGSGSSVGGGGPVNGIKISPSPFKLKPNEKVQLTAVLDGGIQPITWSVNTPGGGTIAQDGSYTAPASSGSYEVQVALTADPTKFAKATANVDSGYIVSVTGPSGAGPFFVDTSGTLQLTSKVQGASSNGVTWTTDQGTISADGLLTAPATTGTANVKATSVADPGKSITITVSIVPPVTIVDGATSRLAIPRSKFNFVAQVTGVASNNVDWTASSGTITSAGVWTADNSYTGDVTITATKQGDATKTATATVKVASNLNVRFTYENLGDVVLALRPDKAPNTCANLISLTNDKFYDGIFVHRYEAGFVVQWGDPYTKIKPLTDPLIGTGGPGYTIDFEANDLLHTKYALGMARGSGMNSAGSQIYICLDAAPGLDGSYVVFGSVASGTAVVDALRVGNKITSARVELP